MDKYDRVKFDALCKDFSQNCTQETPDLAFLLNEDTQGRINTQMDIQRKYVWTEAREQEMWDSLLLNVRIPEFHAIMNGRVRNICDGKQRLTCTFRILRDQIPFKRSYAREECKWLFEYAAKPNKKGILVTPSSIVFSQLPQDVQDRIITKTIFINRYSNLTREEEIALFRKINNGVALSDFSRGMASYYYMRKDFTDPLMVTQELSPVISQDLINDEDLETILVRALLLCDSDEDINLQPNVLEKYYGKYEKAKVINDWLYEFYNLLNRFPHIEKAFKCASKRSILPFVLDGVYRHPELTATQIDYLCEEVTHYHAGRGSDLGKSRVTSNRKYIEQLINQAKEEVT